LKQDLIRKFSFLFKFELLELAHKLYLHLYFHHFMWIFLKNQQFILNLPSFDGLLLKSLFWKEFLSNQKSFGWFFGFPIEYWFFHRFSWFSVIFEFPIEYWFFHRFSWFPAVFQNLLKFTSSQKYFSDCSIMGFSLSSLIFPTIEALFKVFEVRLEDSFERILFQI